jgi:hypothetical protein
MTGVADRLHHVLPGGQVGRLCPDVELFHHTFVQPLFAQRQRHIVDMFAVHHRDDVLHVHVAEQGDLVLHLLGDLPLGAAEQDVRLDADLAQFHDRMLGRLGLQLASRADVGHQGDVDVEGVAGSPVEAELADGLQEGERLDVTHGSAHFDDGHIGALGILDDLALHLVGDVRDYLHRAAQVIPSALLVDDGKVHLAGGEVALLGEAGIGETLVMPQVQVGFGAIVGDEDLPMLERRHGSRVNVNVGVQLLQRNPQTTRFQ